jgi:MOSC domain-containing protein YiiM
MELLAISTGRVRELDYDRRRVLTGIYKEPVAGTVRITALGLEDDVQVDRENHGGPDKAVYAYTIENYRHWERELGRDPLPFGQFGENFTVLGMPDESVHVGDVFRIGTALLQVTQPRVPCFKLGIKMGDITFVGTFRRSGRVGFYLRVLEEGEVRAGDAITRISEDRKKLNIRDAMLAIDPGPRQREIIRHALSIAALSEAWRNDLGKRLKD